jgi:UDP-N-acetylmuramoyl-tripeptide--D-alanyl-D-alanine ligase
MATTLPTNHAAFTVRELADSTAGELVTQGGGDRTTCVSTDTRTLEPGAVFVALSGATHDGHAHVAEAAARGAAAVIVERGVSAPAGLSVIRVESTMRALADLARAHVARWRAHAGFADGRKVLGVTGSAGKTTTRVALAALLQRLFPGEVVATRGNLNNRIGVPMMLFSLGPEHRVAVLELGTSEPGEIAELCRMAQPDVGVLTLIAAAHLEGLGSIEGVAFEKAALARALPDDGLLVGNGDDARVRAALDQTGLARKLTYGRSAPLDVRIVERTPVGMTSSRVTLVRGDGRQSTFATPLVGEAGALACAAAVATVEEAFSVALDGDWLTEAFAQAPLGEGAQRLVPIELADGLAVLDDTYNANPASMSASIRAAAEMARAMGRGLVLVLGEMRELGTEAARAHEDVGRVAGESGARLVFAVGGGETRRIADAARGIEGVGEVLAMGSVEEGLPLIRERLLGSDLVLVKSSRSAGTDRVVRGIVEGAIPREASRAPPPRSRGTP